MPPYFIGPNLQIIEREKSNTNSDIFENNSFSTEKMSNSAQAIYYTRFQRFHWHNAFVGSRFYAAVIGSNGFLPQREIGVRPSKGNFDTKKKKNDATNFQKKSYFSANFFFQEKGIYLLWNTSII